MVGKATWPQWDHAALEFKEHAIMLKSLLNAMLKTSNEGTKSPKEELAIAVEAVMGFIYRATAEPKIQTVLDEVRKLAIESNNRDTSIEEKITHIKHQASSITSSSGEASYASVLGRATTSPTTGGIPISMRPAMPKQSQAPYNKTDEIVIKLQDETANKALEGKTPSEMTAMVNDLIMSMDTARKPIRTARRLQSGDVSIIAANKEESNALREHKKWMKRLSNNARAVTKPHGLLLHGVRIDAVNISDMAMAIKKIQNENGNTLHLISRG